MRVRSVVWATVVSIGMLVAGQVAASANVLWCLSDPPVQVASSSGTTLTVNTTVYLPPGAQHLAKQETVQATTAPDGHGGTLITVQVGIPNGVSTAMVVTSSNRYQVSATGYGSGGSVVTLYLDVPAS